MHAHLLTFSVSSSTSRTSTCPEPVLRPFQNAKREAQRGKKPPIEMFETKADLLNWMLENKLPKKVEDMVPKKLYAVDALADTWDKCAAACIHVHPHRSMHMHTYSLHGY